MNPSTKVTSKDFYTAALTVAKTNSNELKSHQTKAQSENW